MQAHGNATQWPDGYPGRIDAEEDIARGHCFLVTDEAGPLAVFSFAPGPDETYAKIVGTWHSDADYYVIHCVTAVRGCGVARAIFEFAAEHADYLRCDSHEGNVPMRRTLGSFGFSECGTITVANGTQRVAYDLIKESPCDSASRSSLPVGRRHARYFRMQFPADTNRRLHRHRMISTFQIQILRFRQGNCMRFFRCRTPGHRPFHQSADPLSKNSQDSQMFSEWVCSLAKAPTRIHYSRVHKPTEPTSNKQLTTLKLVPKWCYTT